MRFDLTDLAGILGVMESSVAAPIIPAIIGPTGSGKSSLARELADRTGGRLISVDSRKIYRRLNIGTAKPSPETVRRYRYAMIDLIDPSETFSAYEYARRAAGILEDTLARGEVPILVGGTGLYLRALTGGLFEGPGTDAAVRTAIRQEAEVVGWAGLHEKLRQADPEAAARIDPRNRPRLERALEVLYLTGEPISRWRHEGAYRRPRWRVQPYGIERPRSELAQRIAVRTDRMVQNGLFEEVEALIAGGIDSDAPGLRTLGYAEVVAALSGRTTRAEAIEKIKLNTRRYAKRQITWFKHQEIVHWLEPAEALIETVVTHLKRV